MRASLVALFIVSCAPATVLAGCSPSEAQLQTCLAQADARKVASAVTLCKGLTWDECPAQAKIRATHRKELLQCYR